MRLSPENGINGSDLSTNWTDFFSANIPDLKNCYMNFALKSYLPAPKELQRRGANCVLWHSGVERGDYSPLSALVLPLSLFFFCVHGSTKRQISGFLFFFFTGAAEGSLGGTKGRRSSSSTPRSHLSSKGSMIPPHKWFCHPHLHFHACLVQGLDMLVFALAW